MRDTTKPKQSFHVTPPSSSASPLIKTTGSTIPLMDARDEGEFLEFFLFNRALFPTERFKSWLNFQPMNVQKIAMQYPPIRVYRLRGDEKLCAIAGYKSHGPLDSDVRLAVVICEELAQQFVEPEWLTDASKELEGVIAGGTPRGTIVHEDETLQDTDPVTIL